MSIRTIARAYIRDHRPKTLKELQCYRDEPDLASAIRLAALAMNCKRKKHDHQRRLTRRALEKARSLLLANTDTISKTKDFEELITLFDVLLRPIHGIGELYVYDTALRIGAKLGFLPQKVYLHAGTREGAKALGINGKLMTLDPSSLPAAFQGLEPFEIEDALCIYRKYLSKEKRET